MRTDKMHPLPWRHKTDGKRISAVVDAKNKVVCGSFLWPQEGTGTEARQTHAFIVKAANKMAKI